MRRDWLRGFNQSSARSGGMAVEAASFGNILFLLRRHFRSIRTIRHAARPQFSAGDVVLGWSFFLADRALHLTPHLLETKLGTMPAALVMPLASRSAQAHADPACSGRFWRKGPRASHLLRIARTDLLPTWATLRARHPNVRVCSLAGAV